MIKRLILIACLIFSAGLAGGCTEAEAKCRESCEHVCNLCQAAPCAADDPQLIKCEENCVNQQIPAERVDCLLEQTDCHDLWRC